MAKTQQHYYDFKLGFIILLKYCLYHFLMRRLNLQNTCTANSDTYSRETRLTDQMTSHSPSMHQCIILNFTFLLLSHTLVAKFLFLYKDKPTQTNTNKHNKYPISKQGKVFVCFLIINVLTTWIYSVFFTTMAIPLCTDL